MSLCDKLIAPKYDVRISSNGLALELSKNGNLHVIIEIADIQNFNYYKRKLSTIGIYNLRLRTKKSGNIFIKTSCIDGNFIKDLLSVISVSHLNEMEKLSLKKLAFYYIYAIPILIFYFSYHKKEQIGLFLVIGLYIIVGNTIAIYSEYDKFNKFKALKRSL